MKIGAITIGQAPRTDVTADIMDIFEGQVELKQAGGLDGLTKEEIANFTPEEGDYVLVSRLTDGSSVTFAERYILPRLQQAIDELEAEGCRLIMFFCTGKFPETLTSRNIPLIYPCDILDRIVPLMTKKSNIICMTPSPLQLSQTEGKWSQYVDKVTSIAASPYGPWEDLESFGRSFDRVYALRPDQLQLGFLKVLKGSRMEKMKEAYGLFCHDTPPYEVLSTRWLSYGDVLTLKGVEEMTELYYNSGQFRTALELLELREASPFALYRRLADFYERKGLDQVQHARAARYEILLDFVRESWPEDGEEMR